MLQKFEALIEGKRFNPVIRIDLKGGFDEIPSTSRSHFNQSQHQELSSLPTFKGLEKQGGKVSKWRNLQILYESNQFIYYRKSRFARPLRTRPTTLVEQFASLIGSKYYIKIDYDMSRYV